MWRHIKIVRGFCLKWVFINRCIYGPGLCLHSHHSGTVTKLCGLVVWSGLNFFCCRSPCASLHFCCNARFGVNPPHESSGIFTVRTSIFVGSQKCFTIAFFIEPRALSVSERVFFDSFVSKLVDYSAKLFVFTSYLWSYLYLLNETRYCPIHMWVHHWYQRAHENQLLFWRLRTPFVWLSLYHCSGSVVVFLGPLCNKLQGPLHTVATRTAGQATVSVKWSTFISLL